METRYAIGDCVCLKSLDALREEFGPHIGVCGPWIPEMDEYAGTEQIIRDVIALEDEDISLIYFIDVPWAFDERTIEYFVQEDVAIDVKNLSIEFDDFIK